MRKNGELCRTGGGAETRPHTQTHTQNRYASLFYAVSLGRLICIVEMNHTCLSGGSSTGNIYVLLFARDHDM